MNILQKIFTDHYEEMIYLLHPRPSVVENVEKMIHCGDPSYGGAMYLCPKCSNLKFVPFRCHSRFCPTCGNKYSIQRATVMALSMAKVPHRHCVFTIDEELRPYFLHDRSLLNCLFDAVRDVILFFFHKQNKAELFTPGFICVLHTFGRDLKWNPHIHCLISEGGLGKSNWRYISYFNYSFLRNSFQTVLLNKLQAILGNSFRKQKSRSYHNHSNGFYVYAKPGKCDAKTVTKYIGRYLGRPAIATSRIDRYDGDFVTFHYNRHEDDQLVTETLPVLDFMQRLIRHIPEKHFKMVRYYGIYARKAQMYPALLHPISAQKKRLFLSWNQWRHLISSSFGYDPIKCPCCGHMMRVMELYFNHRRVPLEEMYRKVMAKAKMTRAPSGKYSLRPHSMVQSGSKRRSPSYV